MRFGVCCVRVDLKSDARLPVRIENRLARALAIDWRVGQRRKVRRLLERRVQRGERHNVARRLETRRTQDVPREAHAIAVFFSIKI